MELSLGELAAKVGGELRGDPALRVGRLAGLAEAEPGALSFLANPKYAGLLAATKATAVLAGPGVTEAPCALILVADPDLAFARAAALLLPPPPRPAAGIDPRAAVADSARLGRDVAVGAFAVIEAGAEVGDGSIIYPGAYVGHGCRLGREVILYSRATLYHEVRLGDRVVVHSGAVVGSDGFGFLWGGSGYVKVAQLGTVVVGDDVEIGANTTIDRARFGQTVIGPGVKLDNLIQIAHNVKLGPHCAFAAQVGVSGSVTFGAGVLVGGQAAFSGHLTVGDQAKIAGRAGVTKNVPPGEQFTGYPARPHRAQLKEWQALKALPELRKKVRELEQRLAQLTGESVENDAETEEEN